MTLTAWAVLLVVVASGTLPASMVGLPGAEISNLSPPTTAAVALAVGQIGVLLLIEGRLRWWYSQARWAQRGVTVLAREAMPIYLWHVTAMLLVTGVVLLTGNAMPEPWTVVWWWGLPGWMVACAATLWLLVRFRALYEAPALRSSWRGQGSGLAQSNQFGSSGSGCTRAGRWRSVLSTIQVGGCSRACCR